MDQPRPTTAPRGSSSPPPKSSATPAKPEASRLGQTENASQADEATQCSASSDMPSHGGTAASGSCDATAEFVEIEQPAREAATGTTSRPAKRSPSSAQAPETIGDFRLMQKLGQGGMGEVYKAHQISMDRAVALKLLPKNLNGNQAFVDRFVREARTMARLDHPNIVRGYAVGEAEGQHFVAMEFVDGISMQKWMDKLGRLAIGDAVHVVLLTAVALEHAHEQSLIHRDIKPDNILITSTGIVKLADLGLAKATDDDLSLTQSGTGFGTPFYMPLEQARDAKRVDARADIYALGVTLYYFLTGKLPFTGETHAQVIEAKQLGKFAPARRHNQEVPERLDLMIDKMIAKEPSHRYQTCAEVMRDLDSVGVAHERLSFVGPGAAGPPGGAHRLPSRAASQLPKPKPSSTPPAGDDRPERELWVLRATDASGRRVKKQVSTGRLRQLLERHEIDPATTVVTRFGETQPRPISSFGEFASLVQAQVVKAKADSRSSKLDKAYRKIESDQRRRELFRSIGNVIRSVGGLAISVIVVAALAVGAYLAYQHRDSLLQTMRGVTGGPSNTQSQPPPTQ